MTRSKPIERINRTITVTEGKLLEIPANNPSYTVFLGVPYAKPPVGDLRWSAAEPPEKWEGVRKCHVFSE